MKQPYLIQRGTFEKYISYPPLSKAVSLDYMGSAEFEFGALPQSLTRMSSKELRLWNIPEIKKGRQELYILGSFLENEREKYVNFIQEAMQGKAYLKESFSRPSTNFWWDIENDVMFSFENKFRHDIFKILSASWELMELRSKT